ATFAILLAYNSLNTHLTYLLPKQRLKNVATLPLWHQHGCLLAAFFRQILALNLAVFIFTLPATLFLFGKFPLLSLIYNLFVPLGVAFSLFLLLLSNIFSFFLPMLSQIFHALNSAFTAKLLILISNPPISLDISIEIKEFPFIALVITLCFSFHFFLFYREKSMQNNLIG
ncbi:MAG: ComEC/Rec2 family competence protein, partial [Anaerolineae bacterium]